MLFTLASFLTGHFTILPNTPVAYEVMRFQVWIFILVTRLEINVCMLRHRWYAVAVRLKNAWHASMQDGGQALLVIVRHLQTFNIFGQTAQKSFN